VGGVDGTLRGRFRVPALLGHVHGKTGTLSRVIALSGVLDGDVPLAFSIVTNGHAPRYKTAVRRAHEQVVSVLADYVHSLTAASTSAAPPPPIAAPPIAAEPAGELESPDDADEGDNEADAPTTDPADPADPAEPVAP
jgi:hypothetical protein